MRKLLVLAFLAVIGFIVYGASVTPDSTGCENPVPPTPQSDAAPRVNFELPLFTTADSLVCPPAVAFDRREGYGLDGAMKAALTIVGHDDAVEKVGCQNWRADEPISLTEEGKRQAAEWESAGKCGMAEFTSGFILTCDLKNSPEAGAEQQVAKAMQDPRSRRMAECIGVRLTGETTPPTKEECLALGIPENSYRPLASQDTAAEQPEGPGSNPVTP
jgi:hypothetical protein